MVLYLSWWFCIYLGGFVFILVVSTRSFHNFISYIIENSPKLHVRECSDRFRHYVSPKMKWWLIYLQSLRYNAYTTTHPRSQPTSSSGSSTGIGAGAAREFVKRGAVVILTGRRKDRLDEAMEECRNLAPSPRQVLLKYGKNRISVHWQNILLCFNINNTMLNQLKYGLLVPLYLFSLFLKKKENILNLTICMRHVTWDIKK